MQQRKSVLNILLWAVQLLLAALFIISGGMKLGYPIDKLAALYPWTGQVSAVYVRLLGIVDLAGGLGLLLPSLLRIKPILTVWAAIGIIALMTLATLFHISRGEASVTGFNMVVTLLAGAVVWGRTRKYPVFPKAQCRQA
ncbi:DoxX family protein [Chitinophaga sp. G-6-1-13]|uniref:DoxX family protein n=1 Tax=Chitinophaga fulva TaxID=2728842 RepID=A0A848GIA1_9BACT|nr:DoxX family protein [Chitinophaga fulva]NML36792.1 DoxX family protein [Chitinophaga fulva]